MAAGAESAAQAEAGCAVEAIPWLFVSGLAFEARIAHDDAGAIATCHGLRGAALTDALLARLQACRPRHAVLVSFGMAGGLDARLPPGTLVLADAVLAGDQRLEADRTLHAALRGALPAAVVGPLMGADIPALDPAGKADRHRRCGALAIDMESHRVAEAAALAGVPFVVCRAIADPATRAVPAAALAAMAGDGSIDVAAMLRQLLRAPAELLSLPALARDAGQARRALRHAGRALRQLGNMGSRCSET